MRAIAPQRCSRGPSIPKQTSPTYNHSLSHRLRTLFSPQRGVPRLPHYQKPGAISGQTIYVQYGNQLRSYILSDDPNADMHNNYLSTASPLGKALVGKQRGDVVTLLTPVGDVRLTVDHIE